MQLHDSFDNFKKNELTEKNHLNFTKWTAVWAEEASVSDIMGLNASGVPGPKSIYKITLADPILKETKFVFVSDEDYKIEHITSELQRTFLNDAVHRIKGMFPEKSTAFYEYDTWQDFRDDWLVRDDKVLMPYIYPLLFDLPNKNEFALWQQSGKIKISYRRLVVTVYLHKKNVFHDIFIRNYSKADIEHFLLFCNARMKLDGLWK